MLVQSAHSTFRWQNVVETAATFFSRGWGPLGLNGDATANRPGRNVPREAPQAFAREVVDVEAL